MSANDPPSLTLFSGLAADANVFVPQKLAFPQLNVPAWPRPSRNDALDSYSERLADELRQHGPAVIGGASFGGIVALHVAEHLNPLAVVLIGSVRSPNELPQYVRAARWLRWLVPLIPVRLLQLCAMPFASKRMRRIVPHLAGIARQFCGADPAVFRWSLSRILDWKSAPQVDCPVFHIHGHRDLLLPCRYTNPNRTVEGGGHVISLTHGREVNEYIREVLADVTNGNSLVT